MAITRRQFVTRLGALAAAAGLSQGQVSSIVDAMAYDAPLTTIYNGTLGKPRVVWIHGQECTGCSTSVLGIFEDPTGEALVQTGVTTLTALEDATILPTTSESAVGNHSGNPLLWATGMSPDSGAAVDIADVVLDVIDLLYHETIMGPAGDLAYQWLANFRDHNTDPFVLVVEGALADRTAGGAWSDMSNDNISWCSIGMADNHAFGDPTTEMDMPELVVALATKPQCLAVVPIGQCACFGGYPGCKPPITKTAAAGFDPLLSQTGALGTYDYLQLHATGAEQKVINVPGCPTNPWWFVLTVVMFLIDAPSVYDKTNNTVGTLGTLKAATTSGLAGSSYFLSTPTNHTSIVPNGAAVDGTQRLKAVYGTPIHSPHCPRFKDYVAGVFASHPGDPGCLQLIGCKGPATNSLCGWHGWNGQQPENANVPAAVGNGLWNANTSPGGQAQGGHCTRAGHPCMACTEKGYPDSFVPYVKLY